MECHLEFWFPEGRSLDIDTGSHRDHWAWRMHGGADDEIIARFSGLTARRAEGGLDHWASDLEGRLALIIVLNQMSRSLWRGTARAYAQDPAALALAMLGEAGAQNSEDHLKLGARNHQRRPEDPRGDIR